MANNASQNFAPYGAGPVQGRPQQPYRPMQQGQRPPMPGRPPMQGGGRPPMNAPRQPAPMQGRPMPGQKPGEAAPKKGRRRKESDFFYVNRKGVCFLMFVVLLIAIIVLGSGVLAMVPSLKNNSAVSMILQFTSVFQIKDMTPESERADTTDEEGNTVQYKENTQYVTFMELIMGSVNNLTGGSSDEGEAEVQADGDEGDVAEEEAGGFDTSTPFYDGYVAMAEVKGISDDISVTLVKFMPFALVAFLLFALWYMVKAFLALFGKRVFKNFGLGSILMLICAAIPIVIAISMISIYAAEAGAESVSLQFGVIGDYFGGAFKTGLELLNASQAAEASEGTLTVLPFYMGYGQLVLLVLPVVTLLLSFGARRKIPYSIFD